MAIVPKKRKTLLNQCEWAFPDSKKLREELFTEESIVHPAKMDIRLADALVETYIAPLNRPVVIDMMSGIGTSGVSILRKAPRAGGYIGVEYEPSPFVPDSPNYCGMQVANLERTDSKVPWVVLHADSTKLHLLWDGQIDGILFSPPFGTMSHSMGDKVSEDFKKKYPYDCHYSEDEDNIGNRRKYGNVDALLLSPPFPNLNTGGSLDNLKEIKPGKRNAQVLSPDPDNIDNIKRYGDVDAILFSPPFGDVTAFQDKNIDKYRRNGKGSKTDKKYLSANVYSKDKKNIGRTKGKTYWDMMYEVYFSASRIIKKGGIMILHTKNYVRNGKQVMLNLDTIKVCESLGFRLLPCPECGEDAGHTHRRVINNPSMWVNLRTKRWVEEGKPLEECPYNILHEDLMVFVKEG